MNINHSLLRFPLQAEWKKKKYILKKNIFHEFSTIHYKKKVPDSNKTLYYTIFFLSSEKKRNNRTLSVGIQKKIFPRLNICTFEVIIKDKSKFFILFSMTKLLKYVVYLFFLFDNINAMSIWLCKMKSLKIK